MPFIPSGAWHLPPGRPMAATGTRRPKAWKRSDCPLLRPPSPASPRAPRRASAASRPGRAPHPRPLASPCLVRAPEPRADLGAQVSVVVLWSASAAALGAPWEMSWPSAR